MVGPGIGELRKIEAELILVREKLLALAHSLEKALTTKPEVSSKMREAAQNCLLYQGCVQEQRVCLETIANNKTNV